MKSKMSFASSRTLLCAAVIFGSCASFAAQHSDSDAVDLGVVTQIRQEGLLHNSQVMQTATALADGIGERLTGSPNVKRANDWTRDQFTKWGLQNSHLEAYKFGRGWQDEFTSVRMVSPDFVQLIAYPKAWTASTNGAVKAEAVRVIAKTPADLEKYKGKLVGKIAIFGDMPDVKPQTEAAMVRYDEKKLADIANYEIPSEKPRYSPEEIKQRIALRKAMGEFFTAEKVVAVIDASRGDGGTVFVQSAGSYKEGDPEVVPSLAMAAEHFGRVARLLEHGTPVEMELDVRNKFYDADPSAWDTVAEIPGTDKKDEVVMLGAHLDSWHGRHRRDRQWRGLRGHDGGDAHSPGPRRQATPHHSHRVVDRRRRRPARITRPTSTSTSGRAGSNDPAQKDLPSFIRKPGTPLTVETRAEKGSRVFQPRQWHRQDTRRLSPGERGGGSHFTAWMAPFRDLGVNTITYRNTGGTDHLSFDAVGIPGFQFIQDPIEYETRTHHSKHGRVRAPPARGLDAGGRGNGIVRVQRRDARRNVATQAATQGCRDA